MHNPLTIEIESKMGIIFMVVFAGFAFGIFFIVMKNFDSDLIVLDATQTQVRTVSSTERELMVNWIKDNNITLTKGEGYRDLIKAYPDRPWLKY